MPSKPELKEELSYQKDLNATINRDCDILETERDAAILEGQPLRTLHVALLNIVLSPGGWGKVHDRNVVRKTIEEIFRKDELKVLKELLKIPTNQTKNMVDS